VSEEEPELIAWGTLAPTRGMSRLKFTCGHTWDMPYLRMSAFAVWLNYSERAHLPHNCPRCSQPVYLVMMK
jgi:hypothetical protein